MSYQVLILDDEEPARELLSSYVQKVPELVIVDSVSNALSAKKIIETQAVDILLSDIQMDDLTGIDLLKLLKQAPVTIFTTAYSEYALEGFDLDVVDYLVKPISFQRFYRAIEKAIELIQYRKQDNPYTDTIPSQKDLQDYIFVKTSRKLVRLRFSEILYTESYGEYVKIYTKDDIILALQTTRFMETLLPSEHFFRIHRSYIVNMNHIQEIEGNEVRIDQYRLIISKRMKEAFLQRIKEKGVI